jgi:hypothetical protein
VGEVVGEVLGALVQASPSFRSVPDQHAVKSLQRLADALMQAPTADRIQLLVQDFSNLVVGKCEAVIAT